MEDGILQQLLHWFEIQNRDQLYWAVGILLAAYLLRKPLAKLSLAIGAWVVKGLGATLTDDVRTALMPATMMMYTSIGWLIALNLLVLPDSVSEVLQQDRLFRDDRCGLLGTLRGDRSTREDAAYPQDQGSGEPRR